MLVSVDDYREGILAGLAPLDPITLPLADSHGCVLAEDVVAQWPLPSFDNSSMDGYAVIASDVSSAVEASPVTLTVIDNVPAGSRADIALRPGCAVRIMTGAPIPSGTDCIVPVEVTDAGTDSVEIRENVAPGSYIRRAGEDVIVGDVVVRAGTLLSSRQLAVIAAVGKGHVVVYPRPRVAVLSTGSELVEPGTPLSKGMISDSFNLSNGHYAIDLVAKAGTKIKSISGGTVIVSDWNPETGHVIGIQHKNNFISFYKHCFRLLKKTGDVVELGEHIAIIGNSGELSTGPHLHLELWQNGVPMNPANFIAF